MGSVRFFENGVGYGEIEDGIATVTLQMDGKANRINAVFGEGLADALHQTRAQAGLKGIVIASGHKDFCVGADLDMLFLERDPARVLALVRSLNALYRSIETAGVPVVAALTGSALGGGYELALACHHRIALDAPAVQLGLPEVNLGVIPGAGGTQRLPRIIGVQAALEHIAQAKILRPRAALEAGLIDGVAADREALFEAARAWILANPRANQPWDRGDFRFPGVNPDSDDGRSLYVAACAMLYKKTAGAYPAAEAAVSVVQEGCRLVFERAIEVEARAFAKLATSDQAKDMMRTLWFHKNAADKHDGLPHTADAGIRRVGVLGAGMMGSGLAWLAASRGYEVVLKDIRQDVLDRARKHAEEQTARRLKHSSAEERAETNARIQYTLDVAGLAGCDLVIEAVIEDLGIKHRVIRETEAAMSPTGVFASNTSALPMADLTQASVRPANFLGLHFFSPVEQMPLVEVIRGAATSDETLARALSFVRTIKKTPVVVGDGYGFFTTRVFMSYVNEGANLVAEGHDPAVIEWAAREVGMVVPPLQVTDEVSLELGRHVVAEAVRYVGAQVANQPGVRLMLRMVTELGRPGKAGGKGYYNYEDGKRRGLWVGLRDLAESQPVATGAALIGRRILLVQALEALRCLEAGVLSAPRDGDVGAILGVGFAPNTGGPFAWLDRQDKVALVAECEQLAASVGPRYAPPERLRQMAASGARFYGA